MIDPTPHTSPSVRSAQASSRLAVSVVIPAYNAARYVGEAILSALTQTHPPEEVIVVDDGSHDETATMVGARFPQVELLTQPHRGVSAARNRGWRAARGLFIAFLDADDRYLPDKLESQVHMLESNRRIGLAHSGWQLADAGGRVTQQVEPWHQAPDLDLATWLLWKPVFLGAMLFRRQWLERAGGFAEDLPQAEDVELILRLAQMGCRAAWLKQPTVVYRKHGQSATRQGAEQTRSLSTVLDRFFAQPALPGGVRRLERKVRYYTAAWAAWHAYQVGDPDEMRRCLAESLLLSRRPTDLTVVEWQGEFARRLLDEPQAAQALKDLRPIFREAAGLQADAWRETEALLDWSLNVWHPLLAGDLPASLRGLRAAGSTTGRHLAKLAQTAMLGVNTSPDAAHIAAWWAGALRERLIAPRERHEVTTLHLTLFSQAVLRRQWRPAAAAFAHAVRSGWQPAAAPAWGRFVRAAVRYAIQPRFTSREVRAAGPQRGLGNASK